MKKFLYVIVFVFVATVTFSSCNKKANCPAYRSQVNQSMPAGNRV